MYQKNATLFCYYLPFLWYNERTRRKEVKTMPNIDKDLYLSIGEQLRSAREKKGYSLDFLVSLIDGVKTKSSLKRYEDGESRIEIDVLEKICNKLDLNYSEVVAKAKAYAVQKENIETVSIVFDDYFPLDYCTNLSAGTLEELLDADPDARVYVPIKFQMKKDRLHAFKVNGTSMDNVIPDGSIVITEDVAHLSKIKDGTIVVAWKDGEATVKRLYTSDHSITLMPDSTDKTHQPIVINTDDNQVKIIGRVIWFMNPDDIDKYF